MRKDQTLTDYDENNKKSALIVPFKPMLLTGGKEPPDTNWLKNLKAGTVFLAKQREQKSFDLMCFHVMFQFEGATLLSVTMVQEIERYVDSSKFSKEMELFEIIHTPTEE